MSKEIYTLVQQLKTEQLGVKLAMQCAPLIAGLKTSNLLIIPKEDELRLLALFKNTEVCTYSLLQLNGKVTFLLFDKYQLENFLAAPPVLHLLSQSGYTHFSLEKILSRFSSRYKSYMEKRDDFPHEMGVLLGYPIEDVTGFINNKGKNFLYSGYWKVYANLPEKLCLFNSYEKAKEEILRDIAHGRAIEDIILNYKNEKLHKAAV